MGCYWCCHICISDRCEDTRMLELSIHVLPLLTWESICSTICGHCDHGSSLPLLVWLEKIDLFLWLCSGYWLCPRLPIGAPRQNQFLTCIPCYSFCIFLTLIFTIVLPLCLCHNLLSYETCSIYSIFHNSQFCHNCTQI